MYQSVDLFSAFASGFSGGAAFAMLVVWSVSPRDFIKTFIFAVGLVCLSVMNGLFAINVW